jgi:hypothetical protein
MDYMTWFVIVLVMIGCHSMSSMRILISNTQALVDCQ